MASDTQQSALEHAVAKEVKIEGLESICRTVEEEFGLPMGQIAYHGPDDCDVCPGGLRSWHFHVDVDSVYTPTTAEVVRGIESEHDSAPSEGLAESRPEEGLFIYHDFDAAIRAEWSS